MAKLKLKVENNMDEEDVESIKAWLYHNGVVTGNLDSQIANLNLEIDALKRLKTALIKQRHSVEDLLDKDNLDKFK